MDDAGLAAGGVRTYRTDVSERNAAPAWDLREVPGEIWPVVLLVSTLTGVALRLLRYAADHPLWGDEAMLAVNVLKRDYAGLLRPLWFHQVAPGLFLWAERGMIEVFGASEWTLRLIPAMCAVGSVVLFSRWAGRLLGVAGAGLAVAVFAVSYAPIRHGAEVKPYAGDLFVSLVILWGVSGWLSSPRSRFWPFLLMFFLALGLGFSHPAVFVGAGTLPVIGWRVLREGDRTARVLCLAVGGVLVGSFGLWFGLATAGQSAEVGAMYRDGYWSAAFPPLSRPWRLPLWLLGVHTGEAFSYPIGGDDGASTLTFLLMIAGIRGVWASGKREVVLIVLGPMAATMLAAWLGKYPYGGAARTMQHIAPGVCLLAGAGLERLIRRIRGDVWRRRALAGVLGGLACIGIGHVVMDLARPYRTVEDRTSRDFARWFWPEQARGARVLCVKEAAGEEFQGEYWKLGRWELYLTHRSLRARKDLSPVEADRLRCVFFNDSPEANPRLAGWLKRLERTHERAGMREYLLNAGVVDHGMPRQERYLVYEFNRRREPLASATAVVR